MEIDMVKDIWNSRESTRFHDSYDRLGFGKVCT